MNETITLACLYCKKTAEIDANSLTGKGVLNYFCYSECEDRYAATL